MNFYLEEDADKDAILRDVRNALEELRTFMDIGEGTIEESQTEDKDWINNWKEYFHQFYVDDILIVPSWEEVKEEDLDLSEVKEESDDEAELPEIVTASIPVFHTDDEEEKEKEIDNLDVPVSFFKRSE